MKARIIQHVYWGSQSLCIDPASYPDSSRVPAAVSGVEYRGSPAQRGCTCRAAEAGDDRGRANLVSGSGLRVSGFGPRVTGVGFRVSGFGFRVSGFGSWIFDIGFWISGSGFRVFGLRVSVWGFRG